MKRKGRQHGFVQTNSVMPAPWNPRAERRYAGNFTSPPTAGLFTKVPAKPTNHSKFTSRCGRPRCSGCHTHPVCKSKNKAKGTQKGRSDDVVSICKMINWRVVDLRPGFNFRGVSATRMLVNLSGDYYMDDHDSSPDYCNDELDHRNYVGDDDDDVDVEYSSYSVGADLHPGTTEIDYEVSARGATEIEEIDGCDGGNISLAEDDEEEDDDDKMSFYDVGFVYKQFEGEEGWCLVEGFE